MEAYFFPPKGTGMSSDQEQDREHLEKLLKTNRRRLEKLKLQAATRGSSTPPEALIEIEDIEVEVRRIEQKLSNASSKDHYLLRRYIENLASECQRFPFVYDAVHTEGRLPLKRGYFPLKVKTTLEREGPLTIPQVLFAEKSILLSGDSGSGKSTSVRHLALCMADAYIYTNKDEQQKELETALGRGLWCKAQVPLLIDLVKYTKWCAVSHASINIESFWLYLAEREECFGNEHADRCSALFQELAKAGALLMLLDNLDELEEDAQLNILRSLQTLQRAFNKNNCILVVCRSYEHILPKLEHWHAAKIELLSEPEPREFVKHLLPDDNSKLLDYIERDDMKGLVNTPLLLSIIVSLYAERHQILPSQPILLYEEFIKALVQKWHEQMKQSADHTDQQGQRSASSDNKSLHERLSLAPAHWSDTHLFDLLCLLAYDVHLSGKRGTSEQSSELQKDRIREVVRAYFQQLRPHDGDQNEKRVTAFMTALDNAEHLLPKQKSSLASPKSYRFLHHKFQQYLAGHALLAMHLRLPDEQQTDTGVDRDLVARALRRIKEGNRWREPLLIAAQRLASHHSDRWIIYLADELLRHSRRFSPGERARYVILAGELLAYVHPEQKPAYLRQVWKRARKELVKLFDMRDLAPATRAEAGYALARLNIGSASSEYSDPRPGVCDLKPAWCDPLTLRVYKEEDGSPKPISETFCIARFPVTVRQFRRFVDEGPYLSRKYSGDEGSYQQETATLDWWTNEGKKWLDRGLSSERFALDTNTSIYHLLLLDDPDYSYDNQPVVEISWYEAVAFCRWLTEKGHHQGWLDQNEVIRLPTEAEWRLAAERDDSRALTRFEQPTKPRPVGVLPEEKTRCSAFDMGGNVSEWCASFVRSDTKESSIYREDVPQDEENMAVLGGASQQEPEKVFPGDAHRNLGFRVVKACALLPKSE